MESSLIKPLNIEELQPALNPVLVTSFEGMQEVSDFLDGVSEFCVDGEWNVTDEMFERTLRTIQIGNRDKQFIIDLLQIAGNTETLIASQGNYGAAADLIYGPVLSVLKKHLEDYGKTKVGIHLQSDYEMLRWCLGIRMTGIYDCFIAEKNIYAGLVHFMAKKFWAMEDLVRKYLGLELQDTETGKTFDLATPLTDTQIAYSALDARLPLGVKAGQLRLVHDAGIESAVLIDCDSISPFGDMHLAGIGLDCDKWQSLVDDNLSKKKRIVAKLDKFFIPVVGTKFISDDDIAHLDDIENQWRDCPQKTPEEKSRRKELRLAFVAYRKQINTRTKRASECEGDAAINYGSQKQLLEAFRLMGYGVKKMPNTDDKTLEKLAKFKSLDVDRAFGLDGGDLNYPAIDLLRLYRSVDKLLDTYGSAWVKFHSEGGHRNKHTGRIHSNIDLLGAATGRTSSSAPNIQNLPQNSAYRNSFVARPGYKILTIDYSGAELRILAFMSQEPVWLNAFKNDWDVHSVGAEMLYGDRWKNAAEPDCKYYKNHHKCKCLGHKTLRNNIKSVNFGLAYGLQARGLADQLGITVDEAEKLLFDYKAAFPTVMKFLDELGVSAKTRLESRTVVGRRRRWARPDWKATEDSLLKNAKKDEIITAEKVRKRYVGLFRSIEREGKNMPIQGTNADLTKRAMFLAWKRLFPEFGAFFVNMVHDEIVVECPKENAESCFSFVMECMEQAGAEWIKGIPMSAEGGIDNCWNK